jgi:hypothetical protein
MIVSKEEIFRYLQYNESEFKFLKYINGYRITSFLQNINFK